MDGSVKSMMENSRSSFSKAGWNKSGSNMLATAVTLAKLRNLEARRYFFDFDIVGMVVTFALVAYFYFDLLFIHAIISASYLLRKVSKVSVGFILENLDRSKQKSLVLGFVDFCDSSEVDHENIDTMIEKINTDSDLCGGLVQIMQLFLSTETKFSILGVSIGWTLVADLRWLSSLGLTRLPSCGPSSRLIDHNILSAQTNRIAPFSGPWWT